MPQEPSRSRFLRLAEEARGCTLSQSFSTECALNLSHCATISGNKLIRYVVDSARHELEWPREPDAL